MVPKTRRKNRGGVNICCNILTPEPYLIEIGDNVTISSEVVFVTHDNSISKVSPECINLAGKIVIGENCFIGERSTILYGVELTKSIIVAAGSVVVNSFDESEIIIGGNPARKIGTWEDFYKRNVKYSLSKAQIKDAYLNSKELLIRKKAKR